MLILTTKEFEQLYQKPFKTAKKGLWTVHYILGTPAPKIGLSVSKRVFKRAVKRNKTKRNLKEWLRKEPIPNGSYNIILNQPLNFKPESLLLAKTQLLSLIQGLK